MKNTLPNWTNLKSPAKVGQKALKEPFQNYLKIKYVMSSCTTNLSNGKKRRKISWFWGLMKNLVIIWVKSRQLTFWWLHTIVTWRSMSLLGHFLPTFAKIFDWITYSNGWSKTEARLSTKIPTCPTHAKWRAADGGPKYHWKNWKMIDEN